MRIAPVLLLLTLLTSAASAQTFEQLGFLRLNDTTPKTTRTLALGGASDPLGDADMAVDPATLASVRRPMFFVQGARNSVSIIQYGIDEFGPRTHSTWVNGTSLSQIGAAFPLRGFVVGAYYASEPRLQGPAPRVSSFGTDPYLPKECGGPCVYLLPVAILAFERRDERYGVAGAWERGAFAFGAGVEMQHIRERSEPGRAVLEQTGNYQEQHNEILFRRIDDRAIVPNAGIRWRVTPRLAIAAAYNGAGSFTRTTGVCNVRRFEWSRCASNVLTIGESTVRMPDAIRAGASFAVNDRLRVIGEAVRRNYSSLANDRFTIKNEEYRFPYRDVTELHAGAEYRLSSVVLRAGWWRDPSRFVSEFVAPGQTVHHYTAGAGIDLGSAARLDVAYDGASERMQRRAAVGITFGL